MKLRLKNVRIEHGFTQREVADAIGIKLSTYRTWEQGSVKLTLENACIISQFLGCTPNDLCGWYEDHPRPVSDSTLEDEEREIVGCYRKSTPQWKKNIAMTARAAAGESKEEAEPALYETEKRAAV